MLSRTHWRIPAASDVHLAHIFMALRGLGLPFGHAPAGWPPSEVFEQLRSKGLVSGTIQRITWRSPGEHVIF